jgi:hypothetical protein
MTKFSASDEPTPAQSSRAPGFQRRYGLDVQERAIRLRRLGRSWPEISREVGVSTSQIKRWCWARECEEGRRGDAQAVADVRKGPGHPSEWYEAKLRQIGAKSESGLLTKEQLAGLRNAADAYWRAFQIMKARTESDPTEVPERKLFKEFQEKQKSAAQKILRDMKRNAEPIEMTAEGVEDGPGVGK